MSRKLKTPSKSTVNREQSKPTYVTHNKCNCTSIEITGIFKI